MQSVINRKPHLDMAIDPCCSGLNWLAKKTFNLVIPDDDGAVVATNYELMDDGGIELRDDGGIELRD